MKFAKAVLVIAVFLALGMFGGKLAGPTISAWMRPGPVQHGDYGKYLQASGKSLVLFSTSTCPHCKQARDYLASRHLDYQDYVIDKSPDAMKLYLTLDEKTVPILLTANTKIRGFRAAVLDNALSFSASPPSP
ncbi:glutaredoxin family protein [Dyella silvatica]|uniref:glutaredoxin family protein n=1 Tax=Dyella silvatica TaxID=2992128 RepID=UPI00225816AC|nr:glutaredoxin family protein [Dyella silvatica]